MEQKRKNLLSRLCAAVLALLGFASCEEFGFGRVEYGCPSVDYKVSGTVTDANDNPLEGVRVIIRKRDDNVPTPREYYVDDLGNTHIYEGDDTLFTDAKGKYESGELNNVGIWGQKVYFDDVDGDANGGEFLPDSVLLRTAPKKQIKEGSGQWYEGSFKYTVDVQLQKK